MEAEAPTSLKVPGKLTAAECEVAYKKGFPNFVPIADYIDSHHSPCFRSYNLWREAKAHEVEMKAVKPRQDKPKLDSGLWQKLKSQRL
jgi:hypothetical protein